MANSENKKVGGLAQAGIFILCWLGTIIVWCVYAQAAGIRGEKPNYFFLMFVVVALHSSIVSLINKSRENSSNSNAASNSKNDAK